ncbi:MAG: CapA family protein [Acidimicrobiia bacterium]|nr:CapA family protein [Acidimicrobiia bacterium]
MTPRLRHLVLVPTLVAVAAAGLVACSSDPVVRPAVGHTALTPLPPVTTTAPEPPAPTTTVATRAAPTTTAPPQPGWLTIQGVGDSNFDPTYIPNLAAEGYDFAFERLYGLFVADDLTVINLECSISDLGTPRPYRFTFRCDPEAIPTLAANGVDVANIANNHGLDFGQDALLDSLTNLSAGGIAPVGAGKNVTAAYSPALLEVNGWRVAVLGMNGVLPHPGWLATDDQPGMASGDHDEQMVDAVAAAAELADIVIVTIHWMYELEDTPRAEDRARAEAMIAAGADVIFGHHPHRLGELEFIEGKPVFWTLGNFVWPRLSDAGATSAIGRVVVAPDGSIDACMIPIFIRTSGRPELDGSIPCHAG